MKISCNRIGQFLLVTVFTCQLTFCSVPVFAAKQSESSMDNKQRATGRNDRPVRSVKNVILLIPDGCSLATISAARWYQWLKNPGQPNLAIDPYLCGTVRTHSSNAPIGDSAPTTSCYMTGELSRTGYVSTYSPSDPTHDIFPTDSTKAYQPLMTVLEAAKIVYGKSAGLVFTCEFPHATPADCSAHSYNRGDYKSIVSQMVHNSLDVVLGGGVSLLQKDQQSFLKANGYDVLLDDINGVRAFTGKKLWGLFNPMSMPYDLDRNPKVTPSLEEMTSKAIETLSKNKKGFFLMVEGSKVDWAAHVNDPIGMITEFLAFDRACKVALDFALKDGNTTVVILPDHGNSGFSIGCSRCQGYDKLNADQLFGTTMQFTKTAEGLADILNQNELSAAKDLIFNYTKIELTEQQVLWLNYCRDYSKSPIPLEERKKGVTLQSLLAKIMTDVTCFGFTTNGHTGEDVFLAAYHPKNDLPMGVYHNYEINDYLCKLLKLENRLPDLTSTYYAKHTQVFEGMTYSSNADVEPKFPVLTVKKGNNELKIRANSNVVQRNGKDILLKTVVVYMDINKTFYLPRDLAKWLK